MDTALTSRLAWLILTPGNFLVLILVAGCALLFTTWRRVGRLIVTAAAGAALFIAIFPVANWLARPLEAEYPPQPLPHEITGMLILSGGDDDSRLLAATDLLHRYPLSRAIFSGGIPPLTGYQEPESAVGRRKLAIMGIKPSRVIWESKAKNTRENFIYSREIAQPKPGDVWVVVTNGVHMPRAMEAAKQVCWHLVPWPSERTSFDRDVLSMGFDFSRHLEALEPVIHEWLGLIAYRLTTPTANQACGKSHLASQAKRNATSL